MKAYTTKRTAKRARISGTSSHGSNTTQKLHSNKVMDVFRLQNKMAFTARLSQMDEDSRKEYDTLWNVSLEDDSVDMGNMDWEDEERTDPIDISAVLDGEIPIDLSHAGGEFYEMVEAQMSQNQQ
jgi:hypothetical protein